MIPVTSRQLWRFPECNKHIIPGRSELSFTQHDLLGEKSYKMREMQHSNLKRCVKYWILLDWYTALCWEASLLWLVPSPFQGTSFLLFIPLKIQRLDRISSTIPGLTCPGYHPICESKNVATLTDQRKVNMWTFKEMAHKACFNRCHLHVWTHHDLQIIFAR